MANKIQVDVGVDLGKTSEIVKQAENIDKRAQLTKDATNKINLNTKNILKQISGILKNSQLFGTVLAIKEVTNTLVKATKPQAEYIENLNMMQVAFGNTKDAAQQYVKSVSDITGFDIATMTRQLGIFRQIAGATGIASQGADLLSTNLSKLSLDIASLYNVDIERAGKALESAITGQVRSIRSLTGADITQATLQQEAYRLGITKTVSEMNRAEKTILIYLSLERQLANANGDMARTINSVANQAKVFKDQITTLARNIGGFLIPVVKNLLIPLNTLLRLINSILGSVMTFFGLDAQSLASEFGIASGGLDSIEDGLNGIDEASKKAKKSLRGFDKLNNITTPTSSTSGAGSGVGTVDPTLLEKMKEYDLQLDKITGSVKNLWEWWTKLNGIAKIFVGLGVYAVLTSLAKGFKTIADVIKRTSIGKKISELTTAIGKKGGLAKAIGDFVDSMTPFQRVLGTLAGVAVATAGVSKLKDSIEDIKEYGASVENVAQGIGGSLETIGGSLLAFGMATQSKVAVIAGLFTTIGGGLVEFAGSIFDNVRKMFQTAEEAEQELYNQMNSEIWNDLSSYNFVNNLVTELDNYIDKNGKVKESDKDRVEYILGEMNDAFGTEYKLIDGVITLNGKQVDSYEEVRKEIDKYLTKLKAEMILEKYQTEYSKHIERQTEKKAKLTAEEQAHKLVLEQIDGQYDELIAKGMTAAQAEETIKKRKTAEDERHKTAIENINKEYQSSTEFIEKYNKLIEDSKKGNIAALDETVEAFIGSQSTVVEEAANSVTTTVDNAMAEINKVLSDDYVKKLNEQFSKITEIPDGYALARQFAQEYNRGMKDNLIKNYSINISLPKSSSDSNPKMKAITVDGTQYYLTTKADGGFVNSGDIFVANENNKPEYIGSFGNRTAVANTDQIVDGISIGVARAMAATQKDTTVNIVAQGDTSGLLNFINFEQKKQNRQYGLS